MVGPEFPNVITEKLYLSVMLSKSHHFSNPMVTEIFMSSTYKGKNISVQVNVLH